MFFGSAKQSSALTWDSLASCGKADQVLNFLTQEDVGTAIFTLDPDVVKSNLFGLLAIFDRNVAISNRVIQMLQDCQILLPGGITNAELTQRFDLLLRVLSSNLQQVDVLMHMLELLAMVSDREVLRSRCSGTEDTDLLQIIGRALESHPTVKQLQRSGLQLYQSILEHATDKSRRLFAKTMFRAVLDNLLAHHDDPKICFYSFTILSTLVDHVQQMIAPWTDQIINLTLNTVVQLMSPEVTARCFELLEKITLDNAALLTIAAHQRGLMLFVDATGVLTTREVGASITCFEFMLRIVEDAPVSKVALQRYDDSSSERLAFLTVLDDAFRSKCERYLTLISESHGEVEESVLHYWLQLSEYIRHILEELKAEAAEAAKQEQQQVGGELPKIREAEEEEEEEEEDKEMGYKLVGDEKEEGGIAMQAEAGDADATVYSATAEQDAERENMPATAAIAAVVDKEEAVLESLSANEIEDVDEDTSDGDNDPHSDDGCGSGGGDSESSKEHRTDTEESKYLAPVGPAADQLLTTRESSPVQIAASRRRIESGESATDGAGSDDGSVYSSNGAAVTAAPTDCHLTRKDVATAASVATTAVQEDQLKKSRTHDEEQPPAEVEAAEPVQLPSSRHSHSHSRLPADVCTTEIDDDVSVAEEEEEEEEEELVVEEEEIEEENEASVEASCDESAATSPASADEPQSVKSALTDRSGDFLLHPATAATAAVVTATDLELDFKDESNAQLVHQPTAAVNGDSSFGNKNVDLNAAKAVYRAESHDDPRSNSLHSIVAAAAVADVKSASVDAAVASELAAASSLDSQDLCSAQPMRSASMLSLHLNGSSDARCGDSDNDIMSSSRKDTAAAAAVSDNATAAVIGSGVTLDDSNDSLHSSDTWEPNVSNKLSTSNHKRVPVLMIDTTPATLNPIREAQEEAESPLPAPATAASSRGTLKSQGSTPTLLASGSCGSSSHELTPERIAMRNGLIRPDSKHLLVANTRQSVLDRDFSHGDNIATAARAYDAVSSPMNAAVASAALLRRNSSPLSAEVKQLHPEGTFNATTTPVDVPVVIPMEVKRSEEAPSSQQFAATSITATSRTAVVAESDAVVAEPVAELISSKAKSKRRKSTRTDAATAAVLIPSAAAAKESSPRMRSQVHRDAVSKTADSQHLKSQQSAPRECQDPSIAAPLKRQESFSNPKLSKAKAAAVAAVEAARSRKSPLQRFPSAPALKSIASYSFRVPPSQTTAATAAAVTATSGSGSNSSSRYVDADQGNAANSDLQLEYIAVVERLKDLELENESLKQNLQTSALVSIESNDTPTEHQQQQQQQQQPQVNIDLPTAASLSNTNNSGIRSISKSNSDKKHGNISTIKAAESEKRSQQEIRDGRDSFSRMAIDLSTAMNEETTSTLNAHHKKKKQRADSAEHIQQQQKQQRQQHPFVKRTRSDSSCESSGRDIAAVESDSSDDDDDYKPMLHHISERSSDAQKIKEIFPPDQPIFRRKKNDTVNATTRSKAKETTNKIEQPSPAIDMEGQKLSQVIAGIMEALEQSAAAAVNSTAAVATGSNGHSNVFSTASPFSPSTSSATSTDFQQQHQQLKKKIRNSYAALFHPENISNLGSLALRILAMFRRLKEDVRHVSTNSKNDATISVKLMKHCILSIGLADPHSPSHALDVDILLTQLGVRQLSLYGFAFALTAAAERAWRGSEYVEVVDALLILADQRLSSMNEEISSRSHQYSSSSSNYNGSSGSKAQLYHLDELHDLTAADVDEISRLLDREKKTFHVIFESYLPKNVLGFTATQSAIAVRNNVPGISTNIFSPSSKSKSLQQQQQQSPFSPRCVMTAAATAGGSAQQQQHQEEVVGMRFENLLQFSRDFEITPEVVTRAQLKSLFNTALPSESCDLTGITTAVPSSSSSTAVAATDKINFHQFLDVMVMIATRSPAFRSAGSGQQRVLNLLLLLNKSKGKQRVAERYRNTKVISFKVTSVQPVATATATAASGYQYMNSGGSNNRYSIGNSNMNSNDSNRSSAELQLDSVIGEVLSTMDGFRHLLLSPTAATTTTTTQSTAAVPVKKPLTDLRAKMQG